MQRRGSPLLKPSHIPLWRCNICSTFPIVTSESAVPAIFRLVNLTSLRGYIIACVSFLPLSVKSCFHIMDVCWTRPSAYEAANRNKGPFVRPVTTTAAASVNHPFSKITGVHAQVSHLGWCLHHHCLPFLSVCTRSFTSPILKQRSYKTNINVSILHSVSWTGNK